MTAWVSTMTGNILAHISTGHQPVPFVVMFKAIFGFALAGILLIGAAFILVDDHVADRFMVPAQIIAAIIGAAAGAYSARRAGGDAPSR
jgi:hypothetical protein